MRNVLLIEPNYKNKYPPMGLMKLATYFRMRGDNVRFFKGDLQDLAADIITEKLMADLNASFPKDNLNLKRRQIFDFIRRGKNENLDFADDGPLFADSPLSLIQAARTDYKNKRYFSEPFFDIVCITTLFTFYWDITIKTVNFVKNLCKDGNKVFIGGIMASLISEEVFKATGIAPFKGLLEHPGDIDPGDPHIIDHLPLDYSILDEIDYKYPASDAYYGYMTRGCINRCAFCAVPKLEPVYSDYIGLKAQIETAKERYGEKRDLLLLDNNVLASSQFNRIIDEIKECGFAKGAKFQRPNLYKTAIRNLREGYNVKGFLRTVFAIFLQLDKKLPKEESCLLYQKLKDKNCHILEGMTVQAVIELNDFIEPLYEKYLLSKSKVIRKVDFNQGIDARLINDENMSKLAEINISPLRIAFDHWEQRDIYERAVRLAAAHGISDLSNYMLYNFKDDPLHLYYRLKLNIELCEELNIKIYSFPMKYHPLTDPLFCKNRDYIGIHWNKKFIRSVQAILNSTKGKIGRGQSFFQEAFGKDEHAFWNLMWMPEAFIIYRFYFKDNLAKEWSEAFWSLAENKQAKLKKIISENKFNHLDDFELDREERKILDYYTIDRDQAERMQKE